MSKVTTEPLLTGGFLLGMTFKDGVIVVADTLVSFGSLARYMDGERIKQIAPHTLIAAGGEMADFQHITELIEKENRATYALDDTFERSTGAYFTYLTSVVYAHRMRGEFLWNDLVVAGMEDGTPFLGHIDKFGDTFKDCFVGTGYGLHIGLPELRKRWKEGLALEEAKTIMEETTRTLLLRVATTINSYQCAIVTNKGVEISSPTAIDTKGRWEFEESLIDDKLQYQ